eukprot:1144290-Pelagomonas_calceolata.AAC.5
MADSSFMSWLSWLPRQHCLACYGCPVMAADGWHGCLVINVMAVVVASARLPCLLWVPGCGCHGWHGCLVNIAMPVMGAQLWLRMAGMAASSLML